MFGSAEREDDSKQIVLISVPNLEKLLVFKIGYI